MKIMEFFLDLDVHSKPSTEKLFLLFHFSAPQVVLFAVHVDGKWSCLALPYGVGLCCNGADFFKLQEETRGRIAVKTSKANRAGL